MLKDADSGDPSPGIPGLGGAQSPGAFLPCMGRFSAPHRSPGPRGASSVDRVEAVISGFHAKPSTHCGVAQWGDSGWRLPPFVLIASSVHMPQIPQRRLKEGPGGG